MDYTYTGINKDDGFIGVVEEIVASVFVGELSSSTVPEHLKSEDVSKLEDQADNVELVVDCIYIVKARRATTTGVWEACHKAYIKSGEDWYTTLVDGAITQLLMIAEVQQAFNPRTYATLSFTWDSVRCMFMNIESTLNA